MTTRAEIRKIAKRIPGKNRGVTLRTDADYIKEKKGDKGLRKIQKTIKDWGWDWKYEDIKNNEWYPASWRVVSLLAIRESFNWGDKEILNMGYAAPRSSFVVKALLRYFVSKERTFREIPKYWKKHWSVGELETYRLDKEKRIIVLRLKKFRGHPVLCQFLRGYFKAIAELIIREAEVSVEETKCMSQKRPYHEFVITW